MATNREAILKAAAAILAKNPNVPYVELAKVIDIGRATLYRHFPKRDDLIRELSLYSLRQIDNEMKSIYDKNLKPLEILYAVLEVLIPMGEQFHFLSRELSLMQDEEIARIYKRQLEELKQLIQFVKQTGEIASDIPDGWIVRVIDTLIYTAWEAVETGDLARNDAVQLVYRTLTTGFCSI